MPTRRDAAREEGELFDAVRSGSVRAFRRLAETHDPGMRRVVALYPGVDADGAVRRTWTVALHGLDAFAWRTTLRAWLVGILASTARPRAAPRQALPAPPAHPATGPVPWQSLAWSPAWGAHGWRSLEAAWSRLPTAEQEVVWLVDVEGWPLAEACQTVALTAADGGDALARGRTGLADALARHLGQGPDERSRTERVDAVRDLLRAWRDTDAGRTVLDPLVGDFRAWRREAGLRPWSRPRRRRS